MRNFDYIKVGEKIIFKSYGDSFEPATVIKVTATTFKAKTDKTDREIVFMKNNGNIRGEKSLYEYAIHFDQKMLDDVEKRKKRTETLAKIGNFNFSRLSDSELAEILAILRKSE